MRRGWAKAAVAGGAALALVGVPVVVNAATSNPASVTCPSSPCTITVTVPTPTVTRTVTATQTVTSPPQTVTVTASPTSTPTVTATQPSGPGIVAYQSLPNQGSVPATVNGVSPSAVVSFPGGTFDFADFTGGASQYGFLLWKSGTVGPNGLAGSGRSTVFQMRPGTSTQAGQVPPQSTFSSGGTNPLYLMRADNAAQLSGFTLAGTPEGHLYGGLMLYYASGSQVSDVLVKGIPGDNSANPGETFSVNLFRAAGAKLDRLEIDGAGVGASGLGINFGSGAVVTDLYAHDLRYGHGVAVYGSADVTIVRPVVTGGIRGLNFERTGGTIKIDHPNLTGQAEVPIAVANDQGSATVNIYDPILAAGTSKLVVNVTGFAGNPRTQDAAAVHLFVGGVERPDLLDLRIQN